MIRTAVSIIQYLRLHPVYSLSCAADALRKKGLAPISESEGEALARELGALKYIECSALTQFRLKEVLFFK